MVIELLAYFGKSHAFKFFEEFFFFVVGHKI